MHDHAARIGFAALDHGRPALGVKRAQDLEMASGQLLCPPPDGAERAAGLISRSCLADGTDRGWEERERKIRGKELIINNKAQREAKCSIPNNFILRHHADAQALQRDDAQGRLVLLCAVRGCGKRNARAL